MNPLNPQHRQRLYASITTSFRNMEPYRRSRVQHIQSFAGTDYGRQLLGDVKLLPYVNLMQQTAEAYSVALAYNSPQYRFDTQMPNIEPFRVRFQTALNNHVKRLQLEHEFRMATLDAFFRLGVMRSYYGEDPTALFISVPGTKPGSPQAGRVSLDNLVMDMTSSDLRKVGYSGDRYQVRLEDLLEDDSVNPEAKAALERRVAREGGMHEDGHSGDDTSLASSISSRGHDRTDAYFEDMVWLANIWLPREGKIIVVPVDRNFTCGDYDTPPLKVIDWTASPLGPYSYLTFADIPDNAMPYSISENLFGLHVLFNNLLVKNAARGRAQKDLWAYESGGEKDMKNLQDAKDGTAVRVDNLDRVQLFKTSGLDGGIAALGASVLDLFNRSSGNAELMSGLGVSAPTARQEQLLAQQVGRREAELKRRTHVFATSVGNNLAEMIHDDPLLIVPGRHEVGNTGLTVDATFWPDDIMPRPASYQDYELDLEYDSMTFRSSGQKLAQVREVAQFMVNMAPLLQAQGGMFDIREYLEIEKEFGRLPEIARMFRFQLAPEQISQEVGKVGGNSAREYIRRNVSEGPSPSSAQQMLAQQMQASNNDSMQTAM